MIWSGLVLHSCSILQNEKTRKPPVSTKLISCNILSTKKTNIDLGKSVVSIYETRTEL